MKNSVKQQRLIHDLTQEALAQKINVSRQTINAIERRKYVPSTVLALKLSVVLNKKVEELFTLEPGD